MANYVVSNHNRCYNVTQTNEKLKVNKKIGQGDIMALYSIRKADINDADEILGLYHSQIGTEGCTWNEDYPSMIDIMEDIQSNSLYCFADENSMLVACAFAGESNELNDIEWNSVIKNYCDLARICVRREYQNKGIATLFLNNIIADLKLRGFDGIRLLVGKKNLSAIALYKKAGFTYLCDKRMYDIDFYCYYLSLVSYN